MAKAQLQPVKQSDAEAIGRGLLKALRLGGVVDAISVGAPAQLESGNAVLPLSTRDGVVQVIIGGGKERKTRTSTSRMFSVLLGDARLVTAAPAFLFKTRPTANAYVVAAALARLHKGSATENEERHAAVERVFDKYASTFGDSDGVGLVPRGDGALELSVPEAGIEATFTKPEHTLVFLILELLQNHLTQAATQVKKAGQS